MINFKIGKKNLMGYPLFEWDNECAHILEFPNKKYEYKKNNIYMAIWFQWPNNIDQFHANYLLVKYANNKAEIAYQLPADVEWEKNMRFIIDKFEDIVNNN